MEATAFTLLIYDGRRFAADHKLPDLTSLKGPNARKFNSQKHLVDAQELDWQGALMMTNAKSNSPSRAQRQVNEGAGEAYPYQSLAA
jgi:hypothetical protein